VELGRGGRHSSRPCIESVLDFHESLVLAGDVTHPLLSRNVIVQEIWIILPAVFGAGLCVAQGAHIEMAYAWIFDKSTWMVGI